MRRVEIIGLAMTIAAASPRLHAQGQNPLAHIRDLYSNAAYEDVLVAVIADPTASPQIGQYKVFSLIALGRPADAEQAAEGVLAAHLDFHPDSDASPRLIELFATVRRRIAPARLTSMYLNARKSLDGKDREGAVKAFTEVAAVAADPDLKDDLTVSELGLLANGFLELSRAQPTAASGPAAADTSVAPSGSLAANASRESSAASRPPAPVVSQPRAVRQDLPEWTPPASLARAEFKGRILVHIGVNGKVESAEILDSIHPLYDEQLLRASKQWVYKPAMINGTPVPCPFVVEVALKPRGDRLD